LAHDPIFSLGPHVLFKGGIEIHVGLEQSKNGDKKESEQKFELKYGLTGDWVVGVELPYKRFEMSDSELSGIGDIALSSKYRFWRKDILAVQESLAVLLKVKLDTSSQAITANSVDTIIGLTYGFESLNWYRWASFRYRLNGQINQDNNKIERGNKTFIDFVVGYRPILNAYRDPDLVYMLELNSEFALRNKVNDTIQANSGGSQWFLSPGFMWTLRNMAVKGGINLPVYSNLHGEQQKSDYRFKLSIEWHL
jgi:hypothetical protein